MPHYIEQILRAEQLAELGRTDQAIDILSNLIPNQASHSMALPFLFRLHLNGNNAKKAKQTLDLMLSKYPDKEWTLISACYFHRLQGKDKKALQFAELALEIDPEDPDYLLEASRVLCNLKQFARAENLLAEAERKDPEGYDTFITRLQLHLVQGEKMQAKKVLDRALQLHPDKQDLLSIKTMLVIDQGGDMKEAASLAKATLERDPGDERARSTLLMYLKNQNQLLRFFAGNSFNRYKMEWTFGRVILMVLFWKASLIWGGFGIIYLLITWYGGVLFNSATRLSERYKLLLNKNDISQSNFFLGMNLTMLLTYLSSVIFNNAELSYWKVMLLVAYVMMLGISFFEIKSQKGKWSFGIFFTLSLILILKYYAESTFLVFITFLCLLIYAFCFTLNLIFK